MAADFSGLPTIKVKRDDKKNTNRRNPMLVTFVIADDHMPRSAVVEVQECMLKEGASPLDVAAFGAKDFKQFVADNDINVGAYRGRGSKPAI